MKKMKLLVAIMLLAFVAVPIFAQEGHVDEGDPWDIAAVHDDHDNGFCDNISGTSGTRDVDCIERGPNGPREWSTECHTHPVLGGPECSANATVYCPGLGHGNYPGKDYLHFGCSDYSKPEVRAGILEGGGSYPLKKGVLCRNISGGATSCGCIVTSNTSSYFFGNPLETPPGSNYYTCQ